MKNLITILIVLTLTSLTYSQGGFEKGPRHFNKRFEELEKIKLLEILNIDEESTIKFFVRRNLSKEKIKKLILEREDIFEKLDKLIKENNNNSSYDLLIQQSTEIAKNIAEEKSNFINLLNDILNKEQIAKVILFEYKFKKDVRDLLIEKGRKRFYNKRKKN